MAITFVRQGTSGTGTSVTSVAPSFSTNTTAGNAVILVSSSSSSSHFSSASGFGVTVWTDLISQLSNVASEIWGAIVVTPGTSVTVNFSASTNAVCLISEVSGVTLTIDGSNSHSQNTGSTIAPGSITTTAASDFVISSLDAGGSATVTDPTSPWNALTRATGGSSSGKVAADAVYQIATGTFNPSYTYTGGTAAASATIVALQGIVTATPYFLPPLQHRQARKHPPIVRAKRSLKGAPWLITRQVTAPHADFPEQIRRQSQKKRIPVVKAKRVTRSSIELRIPQAPHPDLPLSVRHQRGQPRRIPHVKAKPKVRSSIELRIPQAPHADLPLAVRHPRGQTKRLPYVKAKRVTHSSIELRIPQAPQIIFPPALRHGRDQPKRIPRVKAKPVVRSSLELRIPQAPHADFPEQIRRQAQKKRIPRVRAKPVVRSSIELRIPPAPHADLPLALRHPRGQTKRIPLVRAKRKVRSNIELRIPQAPPAFAPISIRGRTKHKLWHAIRAKRVTVSKFMQLSKTLAPFVPGVGDAVVIWRHRANIQ